MTRWIVAVVGGVAVAWATAAKAGDGGAQRDAAARSSIEASAAPQLQVGGALHLEVPRRDGGTMRPHWAASAEVPEGMAIAGVPVTVMAAKDGGDDGSTVAVPVTGEFHLGLGYRQLLAQDPARTLALADALERGDHALFLLAQWAF